VAGNAQEVHWAITLPAGVTRLHREFVKRDPMRKREVRLLRERLAEALEPHRAAVAQIAPETCIAAGGSARALARLVGARRNRLALGIDDQNSAHLVALQDATNALDAGMKLGGDHGLRHQIGNLGVHDSSDRSVQRGGVRGILAVGRIMLEEIDIADHPDQFPLVDDWHGAELVETQQLCHFVGWRVRRNALWIGGHAAIDPEFVEH
jgi:hypothetical protein